MSNIVPENIGFAQNYVVSRYGGDVINPHSEARSAKATFNSDSKPEQIT